MVFYRAPCPNTLQVLGFEPAHRPAARYVRKAGLRVELNHTGPLDYTHRVAISNYRLLDVTDAKVTFRWKDYAHHNKRRTMTLTPEEFLRRFLQHVLPEGFPRIRYFGSLANRRRGTLVPLCRTLLAVQPPPAQATPAAASILWLCQSCHGPMRVVERLTANQIALEERRLVQRP